MDRVAQRCETVFGKLVLCKNVPRLVPGWTKSICIGWHAFGEQYRAIDAVIKGSGKLKMVFFPERGGETSTKSIASIFAWTLFCLCDSDLHGIFHELHNNGLINQAFDWVHCTTGKRICKIFIESINVLIDKTSESRSGLLQLHLVQPLLFVIRTNQCKKSYLDALMALENQLL